MSRLLKLFAGLTILGLVLMWTMGRLWHEPPPPPDLTISTGTRGGTFQPAGKLMARLIEEYSGPEIGTVTDEESNGTLDNCRRLADSRADLALAIGPVLTHTDDPCIERVRALMALYTDRVQVVARHAPGRKDEIKSLEDLKGKRLYVGARKSGTRVLATDILNKVGVPDPDDLSDPKTETFRDASLDLQDGTLDAAFFVASAPANAVWDAMASGCCRILNLPSHVRIPGLDRREIPARTYPNQPDQVTTLGGNALLIAREDLPDEVVRQVLNTLFDHIGDLGAAAIRVHDTRLESAFDEESLSGIDLHDGVERFRAAERKKLLIATGSLNGKYYDLGKRMQLLLEQAGIPARVIHTDGSLENLRLLRANERRTVAMVQYDTALASIWSAEIFRDPDLGKSLDIPRVQGLTYVAALHKEELHILIRRDFLERLAQQGVITTTAELQNPTMDVLEHARVCLGPRHSGARVVAEAILRHHDIDPKEELLLSVPDMVDRMHGGEVDAGFFVAYVPSEVLKTLVDDENIRLLSVDTRRIVGLLGAALRLSKIGANRYGAQQPGEPDIDTIATRAVLVAREDLDADVVENITKALLDGEAYLGVEGGAEGMAADLISIKMHPGAKAAYEKGGIIPSDRVSMDEVLGAWDELAAVTWRALAIVVILVAGYQGFVRFWRDRKKNKISERVLAIDLGPSNPDSVTQLLKIQDGPLLDSIVGTAWWRAEKLDISRWRYLHDLINDRIKQAKENLTADLAEKLRTLAGEEELNLAVRRERLLKLEDSAFRYFQRGELDASHHALLLEVIRESLSQPVK